MSFNDVIIHTPETVVDNGEEDGEIYEKRLVYFVNMLKTMLPAGHYFFHDTSVSNAEYANAFADCGICKTRPPKPLSSVYESPHLGLKTQLHPLFYEGAPCPSWFDKDLAAAMIPNTLEGYSVFDIDDMRNCIKFMQWRYPQIRIKNGSGTNGKSQMILSRNNKISDDIIRNISTVGVVVEKNIVGNATPYSVSLLKFGGKTYVSIGVIVHTLMPIPGESIYNGTTCIIFQLGTDPSIMALYYNDPIFGELQLQSDMIAVLIRFGVNVAEILDKRYPNAILPRVNFDVLFDKDDPVVVDSSLRVGGNTWSELRGIARLMEDPSKIYAQQSVRMIDTGRTWSYDMDTAHHISEDEKMSIFGLDH